jgi:alkylated DNA repair dioxygenase AlkB
VQQQAARAEPVANPAVAVDGAASFERLQLDETSWVDISRRWLKGADVLFESLRDGVGWQTSRLFRYDHWVEERRLGSMWRRGRPLPDPALAGVHKALERRYRVTFNGFGLIQYRDGRDGQAFHRDTDMRWLDDTLIAIVTLGARRPFLVRPRGGGRSRDVAPAGGDLLVMGGACQRQWEHAVPKVKRAGPRISVTWRWSSGRGRAEEESEGIEAALDDEVGTEPEAQHHADGPVVRGHPVTHRGEEPARRTRDDRGQHQR